MPLTADRNTPYQETITMAALVAAGAKIYSGAQVAANATGFATPGAVSAALTYLGRAEQFIDNTSGADGAQKIVIRRGRFKWVNSATDPVDQSCIGKPCYIVDDQTVAKTNGGNTRSPSGKVMGIDTDGVWVE